MSESAFSVFNTKSKKSKKNKRSKSLQNGSPPMPTDVVELITGIKHEMDNSKGKLSKKQKKRKINGNDAGDNKAEITSPGTPTKLATAKKQIVDLVDYKVQPIQNIIQTINTTGCNAAINAHQLLEWILHPLKPAEFFETYWESQPFHIARPDHSDYYTQILTSKDIDTMLREHPLYFGTNVDLVVYNDGVRETMSPEGRAKPSIVWDGYSKGCSVRILNPQTYNNTIHRMLATLQEYFGTMVGANVYLTPAGSQGFAPHYDDIEAFIIQLEGKKHWKLYKPLNDEDNLARVSSKDFTRDQLGDLIFEGDLNAGDILYFPRGVVHEAKTDAHQHSLHITISTYQRFCYADLLERIVPEALKAATASDIAFRKGLPVDFLKHFGSTNSLKQSPKRIEILKTVRQLFTKLINYTTIDDGADQLGLRFMHDAMPPVLDASEQLCSSLLDGDRLINGQVVNKGNLTLDTEIRLCRYYGCHLVKSTDGAVLYFSTQNGKVYHEQESQYINMEWELGSVIEILQLQYPDFVPVRSMPIEDKEKLLDFVMQLWDYGIVITKEPIS